MSKAEQFREELRNGTEAAIRAVEFVALFTRDPRVQHDASEYLARHRGVS